MPVKQMLPPKAKMTALVWSGRRRPKVVHGRLRFAGHHAIWSAMMTPTSKPTAPQRTVAPKNFRTMSSS
jgi:hypothetical protein